MADPIPTAAHPPAPAPAPSRSRPALWLAEDDDALRALWVECFNDDGFDVEEAENGLLMLMWVGELRAGRRPRPAVVVSDLRMPGASGLDCLALLRLACPLHPALPFVALTAFGDAATHDEAMRLGAFAVLDKPVDSRTLLQTVRVAAWQGNLLTP
jgi:DNA-binding NtrC family response regulator